MLIAFSHNYNEPFPHVHYFVILRSLRFRYRKRLFNLANACILIVGIIRQTSPKMQSSWNQWGGGVNTSVGNYATSYPGAIQPAVNNFTSIPSANPFSIPATSALNTSAAAPAISSQYAVGNSIYGQPAQQQQWQQWEQWQQQYAQWHHQYGDKVCSMLDALILMFFETLISCECWISIRDQRQVSYQAAVLSHPCRLYHRTHQFSLLLQIQFLRHLKR